MSNVTKFALSAAIILSTAFSALAASKLELPGSRQSVAGQVWRPMIVTAPSSPVTGASNVRR
jgi:hypothetical protein